MPVTRFAPSPTGLLHLGHACSALFAQREAGPDGKMLLRFEDIDVTRCRPEWALAIETDLAWLGIDWPLPVRRQSEHFDFYSETLQRLATQDLLYPCSCTRAAISAGAMSAPHGMPPRYPGTCRERPDTARRELIASGQPYALRLDTAKAMALTGPLSWRDIDRGEIQTEPDLFGDVVLARKETPTSYHLAVVADDALQGIEIVTRGEDLFEATHLHRLLQALLGLPVPVWRHHRLILDDTGRRLAKRDRAATLAALRESGVTADEVRDRLGFGN